MTLVMDASAVVLALLNDGEARNALMVEPVAVPHIVDAEVAHALRGQALRGASTSAQAANALDRWARLGVTRHAVVALLPRIWELRENVSAYDACYVALAEALGCALMTADGRLAAAPGPSCAVVVVRR